MSGQEKNARMERIFKWTARIWSLPAIVFSILEVAAPHADPDVSVGWHEWLMVGIMFLSLASLALAWWKARLGGWLSLGALFVFFVLYWVFTSEFFPIWHLWLLMVGLPAAIFLFAASFRTGIEPQPITEGSIQSES